MKVIATKYLQDYKIHGEIMQSADEKLKGP